MGLSGVGTLIAFALNQIVGNAAKELRPYDSLGHVLVLVPRANDYAFPSDHAVISGALMTSVLLVIRRATARNQRSRFEPAMVALGLLSTALGLFLCFARVYAGAHYQGDVVAGVLLGSVVVSVASLARQIAYRIAELIEPTPLGVLVRRAPATVHSGRLTTARTSQISLVARSRVACRSAWDVRVVGTRRGRIYLDPSASYT